MLKSSLLGAIAVFFVGAVLSVALSPVLGSLFVALGLWCVRLFGLEAVVGHIETR